MIDLNTLQKGSYLYFKDKNFVGRFLEVKRNKILLEGKTRALRVPLHFCDYVEINEENLELLDYKRIPNTESYSNSTDWIVSKTNLGWIIYFNRHDPSLSGFSVKYIHDVQNFLEEFEITQDRS